MLFELLIGCVELGSDGWVKAGYEGAGGAKKQRCFEVGKTASKECFWVAQGFSLAIRSLYRERV